MFVFFALYLVLYILQCETLAPELCQLGPPEKHCLIEYSVRDRWPHVVRFVYNWYMRNCHEIRWSDHCPAAPEPPVSNNFRSEEACMGHCSGWA